MKIKSIKETCLYCSNLSKMQEFYGEKLGLNLIGRSDGHVFFEAGESVLLIFDRTLSAIQHGLPPHAANGDIHFAFLLDQASEYEQCKKNLENAGVAIEFEKEWPMGKSFYFRDPENHLVEILERDIWQPGQ